MLSRIISPQITGTYTFTAIPLLLPTALVELLLPHGLAFNNTAPGVDAPQGMRWVVVEAGKQEGTGMGVPGGRNDFWVASLSLRSVLEVLCFGVGKVVAQGLLTCSLDLLTPTRRLFVRKQEAKLEIPFLGPDNLTLKQSLLFSSWMMAVSGKRITGLRSFKTSFEEGGVEGKYSYKAKGWLEIEEVQESQAGGEEWTEEQLRKVLEGWWVGERHGGVATRFHLTPLTQPTPLPHLKVRMYLPSFLQTSLEKTRSVVGLIQGLVIDGDGWLELRGSGWKLKEKTGMQCRSL
ncbi:hypothetical protein T439DRAFT_320032 [Meredithblackwellia eburnea MCA 4105]